METPLLLRIYVDAGWSEFCTCVSVLHDQWEQKGTKNRACKLIAATLENMACYHVITWKMITNVIIWECTCVKEGERKEREAARGSVGGRRDRENRCFYSLSLSPSWVGRQPVTVKICILPCCCLNSMFTRSSFSECQQKKKNETTNKPNNYKRN